MSKPCLQVPIKITRIIDGDTLEGDVLVKVHVRLLDCYCDEANTLQGELATSHLKELALGETGTLTVPYTPGKGLWQMFSFGRILGKVTVDKVDLSEAQCLAGHATREKT